MNRQTLPLRIVVCFAVFLILLVFAIVGLKLLYPFPYRNAILASAKLYELDVHLLLSVIRTESRFRQQAVSPVGAIGLMQIMPTTGAWIADKKGIQDFHADDLYDPETNIHLGSWYLHYLIERFTDIETALAAYNAGPGAVDRWAESKGEMFSETAQFVRRVRKAESVYRNLYTLPVLRCLLLAMPS